MAKPAKIVHAIEVNPAQVGALYLHFTKGIARAFVFYVNGCVSMLDVPDEDNKARIEQILGLLDSKHVSSCDGGVTSFLNPEQVQGRIYIKDGEDFHIYTFLSAPGHVLPTLDTNVCNLPWEVIWVGGKIEILKLNRIEHGEFCFAVRETIKSENFKSVLQVEQALISPYPAPVRRKDRKQPAYLLALGALSIALLGTTIGLLCQRSKPQPAPIIAAVPKPSATNAVVTPAPTAPQPKFFLLYARTIRGPFSRQTIEELAKDTDFARNGMFRAEGTVRWLSMTQTNLPNL